MTTEALWQHKELETVFECMQVLTGEADIDALEAPGLSSEEVYQRLLPLPGLNPDP